MELLYALDIGNSSDDGKVASDALKVLFRGLPFNELPDGFNYIDNNCLVPYEKLTTETACYWRHLTAFLHAEGAAAADLAEQKLLPELTNFCRYLHHYVLEVERPANSNVQDCNMSTSTTAGGADESWIFIAKQLIEMTSLFDLSDEVPFTEYVKLKRDKNKTNLIFAGWPSKLGPTVQRLHVFAQGAPVLPRATDDSVYQSKAGQGHACAGSSRDHC